MSVLERMSQSSTPRKATTLGISIYIDMNLFDKWLGYKNDPNNKHSNEVSAAE